MPKKIAGDLAQTSVGPSVAITGTTATGSASITAVSSTAGLIVGQPISGAGIPANATILAIGVGTITISANATASAAAVALTAGELQVLGLQEWTADWKRKMLDATTTDDAGAETSLGSTTSWTAKAKYAYYDGDPSQLNVILAQIQTPSGAQKWNFFVDAVNSDVCWTGYAYIESISLSGAGVGKMIGVDVSLKGTGPLTQTVEVAPVANPNTAYGQQAED